MTDAKPHGNGNGNGRNGVIAKQVGQWVLVAALGAGGGYGGGYGLRERDTAEIKELRQEVSRLSDTGRMANLEARLAAIERELSRVVGKLETIEKLAAERGPMFRAWEEFMRERQRSTR